MSDVFSDKGGSRNGDGETRRRHRRWFVDFKTFIEIDGQRIECVACDLSPGGACIEVAPNALLVAGKQLSFELPGYGSIPAELRYNQNEYLGLMFLHGDEGEVAVARYMVTVEQNRRPKRHDVAIETYISADGVEFACVVDELSKRGALIILDNTRQFTVGQDVVLSLKSYGRVAATVRRVDDRKIGVMFLQELAGEITAIGDEPEEFDNC